MPHSVEERGECLRGHGRHLLLPQPGASNLHYYLVTYWRRLDPAGFVLGASYQDLPEELLQRIGEDKNLLIVVQVVPGTPAAAGGAARGRRDRHDGR